MGRRLAAAGLLAAVLVAGCGGESDLRAPSIPRDLVPGVATGVETLDAGAVAADALYPGKLASLLQDAGFVVGLERTFSGATRLRRIAARVLVFGTADGARSYVGWLRAHASDVIGAARTEGTMALDGSSIPVFVHLPGGCCPKETPVYLAAWVDGRRVLSVLAAGPGANLETFREFLERFDRAV